MSCKKTKTTTAWEYNVTELPSGSSDVQVHAILNGLGELGWELVSVDPTGREWTFFFKRPITACAVAPPDDAA
jgi:hypothetical protein